MISGVNIPGPLQNIIVFPAGAGESVSSRERNTAGRRCWGVGPFPSDRRLLHGRGEQTPIQAADDGQRWTPGSPLCASSHARENPHTRNWEQSNLAHSPFTCDICVAPSEFWAPRGLHGPLCSSVSPLHKACQRSTPQSRAEPRLQELIGGCLGSLVSIQPQCPGKSILFS